VAVRRSEFERDAKSCQVLSVCAIKKLRKKSTNLTMPPVLRRLRAPRLARVTLSPKQLPLVRRIARVGRASPDPILILGHRTGLARSCRCDASRQGRVGCLVVEKAAGFSTSCLTGDAR
jgi:hypothetical protein